MKTKKVLLIIDGQNYLNRGFYALPQLTTSKGILTNAVKGFFAILLADIRRLEPTHIAITFDRGGKPNWRKDIYTQYKWKRRDHIDKKDAKSIEKQKIDKLMKDQLPYIKKLIRYLGIRVVQKKGVEADDLIATLTKEYSAKGFDIIVSTTDKDLAQLVTKGVQLHRADRVLLNTKDIVRIFGVKPSQIKDYLTLLGDGVDCVEGVPGYGKVTAVKHLNMFGSIKNMQKASEKELGKSCFKKLRAAKRLIKVTNQIVALKYDEPHKVKEKQLVFPGVVQKDKVKRLCSRLELTSLYGQIKAVIYDKQQSNGVDAKNWATDQ